MAEKMDILIDKDDGKMRMVRLAPGAILDSDVVPADHPTRKALEVGLALAELAASEFCTMDAPQVLDCADDGGYLAIEIKLLAIEPPEPVGVEFLRQLLSRVVYYDKGWKEAPFVVTELGLMWISREVEDPIWYWNGAGKADRTDWREQDWVRNASPKTIQVWTPEEENDADK